MSYIVSKTRVSSITINGEDVTSSFMNFQIDDLSANRNGIVSTTGTLSLGQEQGASDITSYDRKVYKRGEVVIIDMEHPDGTVFRHPRGYLYVISSSYQIETEQVVVELGCRLELARITDDISNLLSYAPIPLDPAQETYENLSASLRSNGKYIYQDNTGTLQVRDFFLDNDGGIEVGEWVSVLGKTVISASPASSAGAIPDAIRLSYSYPVGTLEEDSTGRVDTVETRSTYWINYPVVNYERAPGYGGTRIINCQGLNCGGFSDDTTCRVAPCVGTTASASSLSQSTASTGTGFLVAPSRPAGGCGNTPPAPGGSNPQNPTQPPPTSCDDRWETVVTPTYLPTSNYKIQNTYYDAPGAQVSRVESYIYGPAVEVNTQYWADKFAYCRNLYGRNCLPNGNCPYEGMVDILQSKTIVTNVYGEANELVQTIADTWVTTLSGAQPSNWRSGIENGVAQDFQTLSLTDMYRVSRTTQQYYSENNINFERTTVYDSPTSRNIGITAGPLDAVTHGIVTQTLRASSSTATIPSRPDSVNSGSTQTTTGSEVLVLSTSGEYLNSPPEAGPYELDESIPTPVLFESASDVRDAINAYSNYIKRMTVGQARALTLGEGLRPEIVSNWYPSMPFRFADPSSNTIVAYRMDGTTWGASTTESALVTNALWIADSSGTINLGSNLVGNSAPSIQPGGDISFGGTDNGAGAVPGGNTPPSISDEVTGQNIAYIVNVDFNFGGNPMTYGADGVVPAALVPAEARYQSNLQIFAKGVIVEPGGLISPLGDGSLPVSAAGSLLTAGATVINDDLFAST